VLTVERRVRLAREFAPAARSLSTMPVRSPGTRKGAMAGSRPSLSQRETRSAPSRSRATNEQKSQVIGRPPISPVHVDDMPKAGLDTRGGQARERRAKASRERATTSMRTMHPWIALVHRSRPNRDITCLPGHAPHVPDSMRIGEVHRRVHSYRAVRSLAGGVSRRRQKRPHPALRRAVPLPHIPSSS